ncbi:MAG: hypothetical protein R3E87_12045 [Burkholderiaceae bacterium]
MIDGRQVGVFAFRHALLRDYCYRAISPQLRAVLHARAASALVGQTIGGLARGVAGQVVWHHEMAGDLAAALAAGKAAVDLAERALALREAILFADTCRRLLDASDPHRRRVAEHVQLLLRLSALVALVEGHAAPRAMAICNELERLGAGLEDPALRFKVALRLRVLYSFAGATRRALRAARQQVAIAAVRGEPADQIEALRNEGVASFQLGRFAQAETVLERAVEIVERAIARGVIDPARPPFQVSLLFGVRAMNHVVLGRSIDAAAGMQRATSNVQTQSDIFSQTLFLLVRANVFQHLRQLPETREVARDLSGLARRSGMPRVQSIAGYFEGWVQAETGSLDDGIAAMRDAIARYPAEADHHLFPTWFAHLAQAQLRAGQPDDAAQSISIAERTMRETGQLTWAADIYRVRARVQAALSGSAAVVEASFNQSLAVARRQGAPMLVLRALVDKLIWLDEAGRDSDEARAAASRFLERLRPLGESAEIRAAESALGVARSGPTLPQRIAD